MVQPAQSTGRASRPSQLAWYGSWCARRDSCAAIYVIRTFARQGTEEKPALGWLREGALGVPKLSPVLKLPSPLLTTIGLAGGFWLLRYVPPITARSAGRFGR